MDDAMLPGGIRSTHRRVRIGTIGRGKRCFGDEAGLSWPTIRELMLGMPNPVSGRPRPRKAALSAALAERLSREIASGAFPAGSRLPSEVEFARQLDVSRSTLREAFSLLEREGLIVRRQRAGTIVQARPVCRTRFSAITAFRNWSRRRGGRTRSRTRTSGS